MRTDPPDSGPELEQLTAFLDHQRATMLRKTEGLDAGQLGQRLPPSSLRLARLAAPAGTGTCAGCCCT